MPVTPDFWTEALKQVPALAVVCVGGLVVIFAFLRTIRELVQRFTDREDRIVEVIDRNTEAFGSVNVLTHEIREMRRENDEGHTFTRHALRDLANAAGLERELERLQKQQAHTARGGPPGTIQVVTPPVPPENDGA